VDNGYMYFLYLHVTSKGIIVSVPLDTRTRYM